MNQMMIDFLLRCAFIHFSRLFCEFEPTGKNKPFARNEEEKHTQILDRQNRTIIFLLLSFDFARLLIREKIVPWHSIFRFRNEILFEARNRVN